MGSATDGQMSGGAEEEEEKHAERPVRLEARDRKLYTTRIFLLPPVLPEGGVSTFNHLELLVHHHFHIHSPTRPKSPIDR